jgi:hypothetical protein
VETAPVVTTPDGSQAPHPQLGGTGWALTEIDGVAASDASWLSFLAGPRADGRVKSNCSFIGFQYAYDPNGSTIRVRVRGENDGSGANGCSAAALVEYRHIGVLLPRIASWRMPQADQLELLDGSDVALLKGGPLPPLPSPPPGGDCGSVPVAVCTEAATEAFNFALFPTPGQRVVSWRVRDTTAAFCSGGSVPKFDVIFKLETPTFEKVATVGELYGELHACGDY